MLSPIEDILEELRAGRMIVLVDAEDRENEGDLVLPAQFVTPESITFMLTAARGYLCLSLSPEDCDRLDLHPQSAVNTSVRGTPMTVSIDGHPKHGFTTGVSAGERARTIKLAIDPGSTPGDFVRPGHINPLRARRGGVLVRTGQTEGSVDLCRLAGLHPSAIIIEIMRDDGEMARARDLERFCEQHNIKMCSVSQVIEHRLARESLVERVEPRAGTPITTEFGGFTLIAFRSVVDTLPHVALTVGGVGALGEHGSVSRASEPTLVRMHRRGVLGDIFHQLDEHGDCSARTLHASMRAIQQEGRGAIVYLRPDSKGDLTSDIADRLSSPEGGADLADRPSIPAHMHDFGVGSQILRALGLTKLRLLTNHPRELPGIDAFGLEVVEHVPVEL